MAENDDKLFFRRKLVDNGSSLAVNIPTEIIDYLGAKKGDEFHIRPETGKKGKFFTGWIGRKAEELDKEE